MAITPPFTTKGDLVAGVGDNESLIVPVGPAGRVLTADPTVRQGVSWQVPSGGGGSGGPKATASSGIKLVSFLCNNADAWALAPSDYYAPIAAEVGDVLLFSALLLTRIDGDAELDLVSVVGGVAARYLSTGTATPGPNGHGAFYLGTLYGRAIPQARWIVAAEDIEDGEVTLSLLRRTGSGGATLGSGAYPGQVDITNIGKVPA